MRRTFHPRAKLKPDFEWVGYVGFPGDWVMDDQLIASFGMVACAAIEAEARKAGYEVISSHPTSVRAIDGRFPGDFTDAIKVSVRCRS